MISCLRGQISSVRCLTADSAGWGRKHDDAAVMFMHLRERLDSLDAVPYGQHKVGRRTSTSSTHVEPARADEFDFPTIVRHFGPTPFISGRPRNA